MGKGRTLEKDLLATALLEAAFTTDEEACKRFGISVRSLQRARRELGHDLELSDLVARKKALADAAWADQLPRALREALHSIADISKELRENPETKRNPYALERLAGALKLCADVYYTGKVIDARIADTNRQTGDVPESVSAPASAHIN